MLVRFAWRRERDATGLWFFTNYYIIEYYIMFYNVRKIWHKYGTIFVKFQAFS